MSIEGVEMRNMSFFLKAGGMDALKACAEKWKVSALQGDLDDPNDIFVDIQFIFKKKVSPPFFGETDLQEKDNDKPSEDAAPAVDANTLNADESDSMSSVHVHVIDRAAETSTEITASAPIETESNEGSTEIQSYEDFIKEARSFSARFMPDRMWIARKEALSNMLRTDVPLDTNESENSKTAVIGIRRAVREESFVVPDHFGLGGSSSTENEVKSSDASGRLERKASEFVMKKEQRVGQGAVEDGPNDMSNCLERKTSVFGLRREKTADYGAAEDMETTSIAQTMSLQKVLHTIDVQQNVDDGLVERPGEAEMPAFQDADIERNDRNEHDRAPSGIACGLIRTGSLRTVVRTIRRSLSRDRTSSSQERPNPVTNGQEIETHPELAGQASKAPDLHGQVSSYSGEVHEKIRHGSTAQEKDMEEQGAAEPQSSRKWGIYEEVDEIQPNYPPHREEWKTPTSAMPREDGHEQAVREDRKAAARAPRHGEGGSILRKTSSLAKKFLRKLSSSDGRSNAQSRGFDGDRMDNPTDHTALRRKRSSLFGRQASTNRN